MSPERPGVGMVAHQDSGPWEGAEMADGEMGLGLVSCWQLDTNSSLLSNGMATFRTQKAGN